MRSGRSIILANFVLCLAVTVAIGIAATLPRDVGRTEVGIVTDVESVSLTEVRAFTLLTTDGRTIRFEIGRLENGVEFPPGHLVEHRATSQPVRVSFREADGTLTAYRLEDAGG